MSQTTHDPQPRKVPLRVLNLSMSKTGTMSMKAALEVLGYPTYHGFEMMNHPSHHPRWERAINANYLDKGKPVTRADFDEFLGDYAALSDIPVIGFVDEFVEMYPEAKVILVERDIDSWLRSWQVMIDNEHAILPTLLRNVLEPFTGSRPSTNVHTIHYGKFKCTNKAEFAANSKRTYLEHYAHVRAIVPESRLLDYKLGSGWEPLCAFLEEKVPEVEFPRLNESKEFERLVRKVIRKEVYKSIAFLVKFAVPVVLGSLLWRLLYR